MFGRGKAKSFVSGLKIGDIVTLDNAVLTPEGDRIYPYSIVSGNPKNVGAGETLDTEGERGDASARHPRTGIGYSADGTKVVMMVIDGRTASSAGVTTSMLADVMRHAGVAEGVNLDGGGSSTLYTRALGVRNHCSDGNERAVGNAVFAALDAPADDKDVAEISVREHAMSLPRFGIYKPVIYAYNKYGVMVNDNYQYFTLSAPEALGTISEDGKTLASGSTTGMFALTVSTPDGLSTSIPVSVDANIIASPTYSGVMISSDRDWPVPLQASSLGKTFAVNPAEYAWTSADAAIATVENGNLHAVGNGETTVTGTYPGAEDLSVDVKVEIPQTAALPLISEDEDFENWKITRTSVKDVTLSHLDKGFAVDYTITGTRGTKVGLVKSIPM